MFRVFVFALIVAPVSLSAEYRKLNSNEIQRVLGGKKLIYEDGRQEFDLSGETRSIYYDGTYRGTWSLSRDRYCQKFKEGEGWKCYSVLKDAERVRFEGEDGTYWTGELPD